jgi:hypothetical protein
MSCYGVAQSTIKVMKEKHCSQIFDIMGFCIKIAGYIKKRNISTTESNISRILDTEFTVHTLGLWWLNVQSINCEAARKYVS